MVGAGYSELFTCVKRYYLRKHHQREVALRWLMQVCEKGGRLLVQAKHGQGGKVKALSEEHPCSWLPSKTCINHTWHRCGLWWIDFWQDVATKISSTMSLNDYDSQTRGKKFIPHCPTSSVEFYFTFFTVTWHAAHVSLHGESEGWTQMWQSYKQQQINSTFFVLIFIIICIMLFGFKIISPSKTDFNSSVMSLAYIVTMVIQLSNWTF